MCLCAYVHVIYVPMALADIEGAQIYLKQLTIIMASLESIEEILTRHYTRQLLHEIDM